MANGNFKSIPLTVKSLVALRFQSVWKRIKITF